VSLRISAELLGYRGEQEKGRCNNTGRREGVAESASSHLQLLLYVSRFHRLDGVSLEESVEDDPVGGPCQQASTSAEVRALSMQNSSQQDGQGARHTVNTTLQDYSWQPCTFSIRHTRHWEEPAQRTPQGLSSPEAVLPTGVDVRGTVLAANNTAETPQSLFSTLFSTIPSSVGFDSDSDEIEEEVQDERNRLVLQFDLPSSSETCDSFSVKKVEGDEGAEESGQRRSLNHLKTTSAFFDREMKVPFSDQGGTLPAVEQQTNTHTIRPLISEPTTETTATRRVFPPPPSPPQRRLLLLRPNGGGKGATSLQSVTDSSLAEPSGNWLQRNRVLQISTTAKLLPARAQPTGTDVAATPASPFPLPSHSPPPTAVSPAAPDKVVEPSRAASPMPSPCQRPWVPYMFSFTYRPTPATLESSGASVGTGEGVPPVLLRRRLVAVHMTFRACTTAASGDAWCDASLPGELGGAEGECSADLAQPPQQAFWSRASVASCGWFTGRAGGRTESTHPHGCNGDSSGYALLMGDASLHSCWMCPLVAPVVRRSASPASHEDKNVTTGEEDRQSTPLLIVGPFTDVWVTDVSAHVVPRVRDDDVVLLPIRAQHPCFQTEAQEDGVGNTAACSAHATTHDVTQLLPCLHFTPTWLSQLLCAFGAAQPRCKTTAEHGTLAHQREPQVQWPSLSVADLVWAASQVTTACVLLHAYSSSSTVSDLSRYGGAPSASGVCLQSDVHLIDGLYAYFERVRKRWLAEVAPVSVLHSAASATDVTGDGGQQAPQVVLTRIAPASLSLRGGAVGSLRGIVVAEETARTADFGGSASGSLQTKAAMLRARVAVTAAILQYLLWSSLRTLQGEREEKQHAEIDHAAVDGARATHVAGSETTCSRAATPASGGVDKDEVTVRFACVSRALALQWVCGSSAVASLGAGVVQWLLEEEKTILTSACTVGRLIESEKSRGNKGQSVVTSVAVEILEAFRQQYTAASLVALSWLSHSAAAVQWTRDHGVTTSGTLAEQQQLCLWALHPCLSSKTRVALRRRGLPSFWTDVHPPTLSGAPTVGKDFTTSLKGTIDVRIQHTAALNALHIELDWRTTSPCTPAALTFITPSDTTPVSVELPFLLLVFVLQGRKESGDAEKRRAAPDGDETSDNETSRAAPCQRSHVRLYQATPFSWHLPAQSCTAGVGTTAHLSLSVMHALDLVARRPDAFGDFNVSAVTGLGGAGNGEKGEKRRGQGGGGGAKRHRQARLRSVIGATKDTVGVQVAGLCLGRNQTRKRRRTQHSFEDEEDRSECSSGSGSEFGGAGRQDAFSEGDSIDSESNAGVEGQAFLEADSNRESGDDDESGTLFLNLGCGWGSGNSGGRRGGRRGDKVDASSSGSAATGHYTTAGLRSCESFTALDTARVIPLVVLRRDCAISTLLEVEVRHAALLAAQLVAAGYTSDRDDAEAKEDGTSRNASATAALCGILHHLTAFATADSAVANLIAQLRHRQQQLSAMPLFTVDATTLLTDMNALTEPGVLCAYGELLRGVLRALTNPIEASDTAALQQMVAVDRVLADVLSTATILEAVRSALREYARHDAACRAHLMLAEREREFDDYLLASSDTANPAVKTSRTQKGSSKVGNQHHQEQQQHRRRMKVEQRSTEKDLEAVWLAEDAENKFICSFFDGVLRSFLRTRWVPLCERLSGHEQVITDLERWTQVSNTASLVANPSFTPLKEKLDRVEEWATGSTSALVVAPKRSAPLSVAPSLLKASSPTLRLQLRATPTSRWPAAPTHIAFSPAASPIVKPCVPSLMKLRSFCAAQLNPSCASPLKGEQQADMSSCRPLSSPQACFDVLSASADALLTRTGAPPPSSSAEAAASLGLALAQVAKCSISAEEGEWEKA
jgi:hypothetical protein